MTVIRITGLMEHRLRQEGPWGLLGHITRTTPAPAFLSEPGNIFPVAVNVPGELTGWMLPSPTFMKAGSRLSKWLVVSVYQLCRKHGMGSYLCISEFLTPYAKPLLCVDGWTEASNDGHLWSQSFKSWHTYLSSSMACLPLPSQPSRRHDHCLLCRLLIGKVFTKQALPTLAPNSLLLLPLLGEERQELWTWSHVWIKILTCPLPILSWTYFLSLSDF